MKTKRNATREVTSEATGKQYGKPSEYNRDYTPPGRDLYCSPCRLYEPTYRSSPHIPLQEVMWQAEEEVYSDNLLRRLSEQTSSGGYVYLEFLKITAPIVFNQRFEPGTLGSESQCSSTVPSWDLYVRSGDNVVNAKARAN